MQISFEDFLTIVGDKLLHAAKLHALPTAHKRVVKLYCDKLTMRNACSGECSTCALKIKHAAQYVAQTPNVKIPFALFTAMVKRVAADKIEEAARHIDAKVEANSFGEPTERNAFDIFEETLNG